MPYQNDNELTETDIYIEELNITITSLRIQITELERNISNLSKMTIKLCDDIGNVLPTQLEDNLGNIEINADINKKIGEQDLAEMVDSQKKDISTKSSIIEIQDKNIKSLEKIICKLKKKRVKKIIFNSYVRLPFMKKSYFKHTKNTYKNNRKKCKFIYQ